MLAANKTWSDIQKEISETMRKWRVDDWMLTPAKAPQRRDRYHTYEQRKVTIRFALNNFSLGYRRKEIVLVAVTADTAHENLQLLALAVESLRMNDVRGIREIVKAAYQQQQPTPPPAAPQAINENDPYVVLGVPTTYPLNIIEAIWKARLRAEHPDAGGTNERAAKLNAAMDEIRKART